MLFAVYSGIFSSGFMNASKADKENKEKFFLKEFLNSYLEKKVFGMGNTIQKKAI